MTWQPSRSNKPYPEVYSLQIVVDPENSDRIYVGAYNEFGYLEPDSIGKMAYNSLKDSVSEKELGEFWEIPVE